MDEFLNLVARTDGSWGVVDFSDGIGDLIGSVVKIAKPTIDDGYPWVAFHRNNGYLNVDGVALRFASREDAANGLVVFEWKGGEVPA